MAGWSARKLFLRRRREEAMDTLKRWGFLHTGTEERKSSREAEKKETGRKNT